MDPTPDPDPRMTEARRRLEEHGLLTLRGPAAEALARRLEPDLAVELHGARDEADIVRGVGFALDLGVPGDTGAVGEALARHALVWLAGVDGAALGGALEALRALAGGVRFVISGAGPLPGEPLEVPGPRSAVKPGIRGFLTQLPSPALAAKLRPEIEALLPVAEGASPPHAPSDAEILALRLCGAHLPPSLAAVRCAAAGTRLLAAAGQLGEGRDLAAIGRTKASNAEESARLDWAEGDALLGWGLLSEATQFHRAALQALRAAASPLAPTLLRRSAEALAARGHPAEAALRLREARALEPSAAVLRSNADLAVAAGEVVSAEALYDQVESILAGAAAEGQNLAVSRAGLAIARGELSAASSLLDSATNADPLLRAAVSRRRADLYLRQGRHEEAAAELGRAIVGFQRCGQRAAAAAAMRLLGDVHAAGGRLVKAGETYQAALVEHARTADLHGARRTLHHLLTLERAGNDGRRVEELLGLLDALDAELGSESWRDGVKLSLRTGAQPVTLKR